VASKPIILTLALSMLATSAAGADRIDDPLEAHARARLVRLPVILEELSPGGCRGITPEEIAVTEDGVVVQTTHFEPRRLETVHAILVDTGYEMLEAVLETRRAVQAYLGQLPWDEPALLATFDDDLVLRSPLSRSRSRFLAALEWIEVGWDSPLWDSTRQLIDYLASRPERKVLLLLTDGCQPERRGDADATSVIDAASRVDSLVVFPVRLRHPAVCDAASATTAKHLKQLARQTGGVFHDLRSPGELEVTLDLIRRRVDRERYVTYRPLPFGQARDDPQHKSFRWRRRKIGFRTERDCKISTTGSELRYESLAQRYPPPRTPRPGQTLVQPFVLAEDGESAVGQVVDRVQDSGVLAIEMGLKPSRYLGQDHVESVERRTARRRVSVATPPLERLLREINTPEAALMLAFEMLGDVPEIEGAPALRVPLLVHGTTLLDVRESLSAALAGRPDYLEWARRKVKLRRLREIDELIAQAGDDTGAAGLKRVRQGLEEHEWTPEPLELQTYLAGWLGDVTLMELSNRIEYRLATGLLAGAAHGGAVDIDAAAARAERTWNSIVNWFPPPTSIRIVGLQVPVYDPAQDAIGFYRVLLRAPLSAEINARLVGAIRHKFLGEAGGVDDDSIWSRARALNFTENEALGLRLTRWLLSQATIAPLLRNFRLREVSYAHPTARDLLPMFIEAGERDRFRTNNVYMARQVTLVFAPTAGPDESVPLAVYFPQEESEAGWRYGSEPVCIVLPAEPPQDPASIELLRALMRTQLGQAPPCVLHETG